MNSLALKPLTLDLLPAVLELDRLTLGGLWTEDGYRREIDSPNSDLLILTEQSEEATILGFGCLWAILEEAHITTLAIHPNYQRQGLGQAILCALIRSAWQRKLEWVTLEVRLSNEGAIALYQKYGFKEVGRRKKYYQDTGEDALIFWCNGLQKPEFPAMLHLWEEQVSDRLLRSGWHFASENVLTS